MNGQEQKRLPPAAPLKLCAGQQCQERDSCARFRIRGGYMRYASFDIERIRLNDTDCPHFTGSIRR